MNEEREPPLRNPWVVAFWMAFFVVAAIAMQMVFLPA